MRLVEKSGNYLRGPLVSHSFFESFYAYWATLHTVTKIILLLLNIPLF